MYKYKWKPSKSAAREFAKQMQDIDIFCTENGIQQSVSGNSYYFIIDGKHYRISNHTIEASNRRAYNEFGEKIREKYHADERDPDTVYIYASKTRIKEIYTAIASGATLDGRGNIINK